MADVTTIPTDELLKDRADSVSDIQTCELALKVGITAHRDGMTVQYRLDRNKEFIETIDRELQRRGVSVQEVTA